MGKAEEHATFTRSVPSRVYLERNTNTKKAYAPVTTVMGRMSKAGHDSSVHGRKF